MMVLDYNTFYQYLIVYFRQFDFKRSHLLLLVHMNALSLFSNEVLGHRFHQGYQLVFSFILELYPLFYYPSSRSFTDFFEESHAIISFQEIYSFKHSYLWMNQTYFSYLYYYSHLIDLLDHHKLYCGLYQFHDFSDLIF